MVRPTSRRSLAMAVLSATLACSPRPASQPPAAAPAPSDVAHVPGEEAAGAAETSGLYTEPQADRGRIVFRETCSECHYSSEMRDGQFRFEWERRTVGDLLGHLVKTMPEDAPGSLDARQYVDVVAYILSLNGFPAGGAELTDSGAALDASLRVPRREAR